MVKIFIAFSGVVLLLISWLIRYTLSRNSIGRSTAAFSSQRQIASYSDNDLPQIIEKIKLLYLHGLISKIYIGENYIRFEDTHSLNPIWNVYHIEFSSPLVLRYRGFMMQYRINLENLEGIVFFLSS